MNVPLMDIAAQNGALRAELEAALRRCLDHGEFCLGREVEAFEESFARWVGVPHAVAVNSGTSALHLAARLLDLKPGDEVITTPMTFVSTCWALSYEGVRPVFADVDALTVNLDPEAVRAKITPKTKAVFAVHLYGQMCDVRALRKLCDEHGIVFVEDAAQAHGAERQGLRAGASSVLSTFSFYPGKNLGALGEGGMLVTPNEAMAERARRLRNHGSPERYVHEEVGYNYRMEGLQAAALGVKLQHLDAWTRLRQERAQVYFEQLAGLPLELPVPAEDSQPVYHLFVVCCPERDELAEFLGARGIGTARHYPIPLHLQKCYAHLGYRKGDFPVAETIAGQCLSLPLFPEMSEAQQAYVIENVRAFFK